MCGVLTLLTSKSNEAEASLYGPEMLKPLRESRGPDAGEFEQIKINSQVKSLFFGHARLSIIDLSETANQPMVDAETGFSLTYNGEIYNYRELRAQLESSYRFRTQSDTEVLLAGLQTWGLEETLGRLKGMFSFVAYSPATNELWAARDRAGEKPLSYGKVGQDWVFSSDLRVLRGHPGWERKISLKRLSQYFDYRFVPHPYSLFEDFSKLSPGCYLKMSLDGESEPVVDTYWSVWEEWSKPKREVSQSEIRDTFESVVQRMLTSSDVPVGCFLSGGVDSSLVAAVAAKYSERPMKAYTIQFLEKGYDESLQAAQVAKALGLEHTILPFDAKDFKSSFNEMIEYMDEPVAVHSFFPLGALAKRAKQDVKVCLSGDGGDETFGGYNRYIFWQKYMKVLMEAPPSMRRTISVLLNCGGAPLVAQVLSFLKVPQAKDKLHKVQRALKSKDLQSYYVQLLQQPKNPLRDQFSSYEPQFSIAKVMSAVEQLMAMDFSFYLPGDVLNKVDRATMAYGLEARAPFLDIDMLKLCSNISVEQKIDSIGGKAPLRKWLEELLAGNYDVQNKSGFTTPIEKWGAQVFSGERSGLLRDSELSNYMSDGFYQNEGVNSEFTETDFVLCSLGCWVDKNNIKIVN